MQNIGLIVLAFPFCVSCGVLFGPVTTERLVTTTVSCRSSDISFSSKSGICEVHSSNYFTGQPETDKHGMATVQSCRLLPDGGPVLAAGNECTIDSLKVSYDPERSKAVISRDGEIASEVDCTSSVSTESNLGATRGLSCEDVY